LDGPESSTTVFLSRALSSESSCIIDVAAEYASVYVVSLASRVLRGLPVVSYLDSTHPLRASPYGGTLRSYRLVPELNFREESQLSSHDLSPHSNVLPDTLPPPFSNCPKASRGIETDSHEVSFPLSALETGSDLQRAYLTRLRCVLRFSQPLNALFPLVPFTALFHAAYTPGVSPSRGFPSLKS
jgi:hypothetical protein